MSLRSRSSGAHCRAISSTPLSCSAVSPCLNGVSRCYVNHRLGPKCHRHDCDGRGPAHRLVLEMTCALPDQTTQKSCWRCGADFPCGAADVTEKCWCDGLAAILP